MPHPEINKWSCLPHPKSVTLNDFEQRNGHYVALFRRIDSLVKFSDGWTKCLSKFYDFGLGSILSYISDGGVSRPFGRLQRGCQKEIKGRRQNIKACWQTSRGLNNATTHCERETVSRCLLQRDALLHSVACHSTVFAWTQSHSFCTATVDPQCNFSLFCLVRSPP